MLGPGLGLLHAPYPPPMYISQSVSHLLLLGPGLGLLPVLLGLVRVRVRVRVGPDAGPARPESRVGDGGIGEYMCRGVE